MTRRISLILAIAIAPTLAGCLGVKVNAPVRATNESPRSEKASKKKTKSTDKADADKIKRKHAKLVRELQIANEKKKKAMMGLDYQRTANREAVEKAEFELDLAQEKLQSFERQDAQLRLEKARLALLRSRDRLKESEEELQQLEMMYAEEDLADKTREIVLERGRRRLERARKDLAIQERSLKVLETVTLPHEKKELQSKMVAKTHAVSAASRKANVDLMDKQIALVTAESEIERIKGEIAQAESDLRDARK
jgi:hypothetical protein